MSPLARGFWPVVLFVATACSSGGAAGPAQVGETISDTTKVALVDLGTGTYRGFQGGLYPNGSSAVPSAHMTEGLARAARIRPLNANGIASPGGKIVLISIGMSNTSQEFCAVNGTLDCFPETFMGRAAADAQVNHSSLVIVNGAQGGRDAGDWVSPAAQTFDVARDRLTQLGVTENQVEIVWLLQADADPSAYLPSASADAYVLENRLGSIVRALRTRYPNLQQAFLGTRNYGGYSTGQLNPEPYAYESGFAVKWLIQAQINQMQTGQIADTKAGDVNYRTIAPWLAWGPYTWASGTTPRSDGLLWLRADFGPDGTHPSDLGRGKVGSMLMSFFKSSPFTKCWFVGGNCA